MNLLVNNQVPLTLPENSVGCLKEKSGKVVCLCLGWEVFHPWKVLVVSCRTQNQSEHRRGTVNDRPKGRWQGQATERITG